MKWAAFLIQVLIMSTTGEEISRAKKRRMVFSDQDVFIEEDVSVDIQKIKPIQNITGSQYLRRF